MPRYFFDFHECGRHYPDEEGRLLGDRRMIHAVALHEARQLMAAEVQEGRLCLSCRIEVLDEDRRPVMAISFKDALEVKGI